MEILITGGGGFIGSHLTEELLRNHEVTVVDNFCSSSRKNIREFKEHENFNLIETDILEDFEIHIDPDYIIHMASRASPVDYREHPVHTIRTNTEGTLKMLEIAYRYDAKFMFTSTSEVYGDPEIHPQPEDYWGNVNPNGPRACYDEGKRCGEAAIASYVKKNPVDYRIVRIFNTYGPRLRTGDGRVISNFVTQALNGDPITVYGDGKQTRSFCYVDDLVSGLLRAMDSKTEEIFNLGNPDEKSIIELAEIIKDIIQPESDIVYRDLPEDDPEQRKPDISKARKKLGWEPETELEEGLRKTIDYFREIV